MKSVLTAAALLVCFVSILPTTSNAQIRGDSSGTVAVILPFIVSDGFISGRGEIAPFTMALRFSPGMMVGERLRVGVTGAALYLHPAWVGAAGVYAMVQPVSAISIAGQNARLLLGVEAIAAGGGHRFGSVTTTIEVDQFLHFGLRADDDPEERAIYWQGFVGVDLSAFWR